MTDEITGVDQTDVSDPSTDEQAGDTNIDTDDTNDQDAGVDTDGGDDGDQNMNMIPQDRFGQVVQERNAEREAREKAEKEVEFYKNFVGKQNAEPANNDGNKPDGVDFQKYLNDDGELDLNSYTRDLEGNLSQKIKNEIRQEQEYDRLTDAEWNDAATAYPELASNPVISKLVKSAKTQSLIDGKYVTYKEIADEVFSELGRSKASGADSVIRSEKIQSGAGLANMGSTQSRQSAGTLTNADVAKMTTPQYQKALESGEIARAMKAGTLKGAPVE